MLNYQAKKAYGGRLFSIIFVCPLLYFSSRYVSANQHVPFAYYTHSLSFCALSIS